jgi:hypothetical protein
MTGSGRAGSCCPRSLIHPREPLPPAAPMIVNARSRLTARTRMLMKPVRLPVASTRTAGADERHVRPGPPTGSGDGGCFRLGDRPGGPTGPVADRPESVLRIASPGPALSCSREAIPRRRGHRPLPWSARIGICSPVFGHADVGDPNRRRSVVERAASSRSTADRTARRASRAGTPKRRPPRRQSLLGPAVSCHDRHASRSSDHDAAHCLGSSRSPMPDASDRRRVVTIRRPPCIPGAPRASPSSDRRSLRGSAPSSNGVVAAHGRRGRQPPDPRLPHRAGGEVGWHRTGEKTAEPPRRGASDRTGPIGTGAISRRRVDGHRRRCQCHARLAMPGPGSPAVIRYSVGRLQPARTRRLDDGSGMVGRRVVHR